jgi:hypothetical protein
MSAPKSQISRELEQRVRAADRGEVPLSAVEATPLSNSKPYDVQKRLAERRASYRAAGRPRTEKQLWQVASELSHHPRDPELLPESGFLKACLGRFNEASVARQVSSCLRPFDYGKYRGHESRMQFNLDRSQFTVSLRGIKHRWQDACPALRPQTARDCCRNGKRNSKSSPASTSAAIGTRTEPQ